MKGRYSDLNFLSMEVQVLFEVIGECSHHHVFVGLSHSPAINPAHIHKVDQRTQYRLYRSALDLADPLGIDRVPSQLLMHPVIVGFVDAFFKFLKLGRFAAALLTERAAAAHGLRTSVAPFLIAFAVGLDALEGQYGTFST